MVRYVAFLRGINVGGNNLIKMEELVNLFKSLGYTNVTSFLNSGNILFDSSSSNFDKLQESINKKLNKNIKLFVIAFDNLLKIKVLLKKSKSRLLVAFSKLEKNLKCNDIILYSKERITIIKLNPLDKTLNIMKYLEKELSKDITTRTGDTVLKIIDFV